MRTPYIPGKTIDLRRDKVVRALVDAGHSRAQAITIANDAERGDDLAKNWIAIITQDAAAGRTLNER